MRLEYAVDKLVETGWHPSLGGELETLSDGRRFPSVLAVQREFARAGLELLIKHNLMFSCYRATWAPIGEPIDPDAATVGAADECHGTIVAACEREAAVFALAQLRTARAERLVAMA